MKFKLINTSNFDWSKAVDFEADSIDAACDYVLNNSYKFSNYHILRDDTVQVCYKTVNGDWFLAAFIDLHKNEVVTKLYDGRRAPEPYVENASHDSEDEDDLAKRLLESFLEKVKNFFFEEVEDEVIDETEDKYFIDPGDYLIK